MEAQTSSESKPADDKGSPWRPSCAKAQNVHELYMPHWPCTFSASFLNQRHANPLHVCKAHLGTTSSGCNRPTSFEMYSHKRKNRLASTKRRRGQIGQGQKQPTQQCKLHVRLILGRARPTANGRQELSKRHKLTTSNSFFLPKQCPKIHMKRYCLSTSRCTFGASCITQRVAPRPGPVFLEPLPLRGRRN